MVLTGSRSGVGVILADGEQPIMGCINAAVCIEESIACERRQAVPAAADTRR